MCKALSFVDACTEEHFAAMSRSSPPGFRRAGAPFFIFHGRQVNRLPLRAIRRAA